VKKTLPHKADVKEKLFGMTVKFNAKMPITGNNTFSKTRKEFSKICFFFYMTTLQ